jgi:hypothetical protein
MRPHSAALALATLLGACASLGPPPPPPTTAEIVQMARDGLGADEIVKRIAAARAVYPLPASELARLRGEGVPDEVIDFMQRTYLDAVWLDGFVRAQAGSLVPGWPYFWSTGPSTPLWPYPQWNRIRP